MRCPQHPDEDEAACPRCAAIADGPRDVVFEDQPAIAWLLTLSDRAFLHKQHVAIQKGH